MKIIKHYESKIEFNLIDHRNIKFNIQENFTLLDIRLNSTEEVRISVIIDHEEYKHKKIEFELYLLVSQDHIPDNFKYIKTIEFSEYIYHVFRKTNYKSFLECTPV
jgi:hypothetical protein